MVLHGHVRNGVVVLDEHAELPEGAAVRVEVVSPTETGGAQKRKRRQGGQWKGQVAIAADFDELPDDLAEAFGMRTP